MLLVVVPSAIVGARLFSVLDNYGYYSHHLLDVVKPPYIGLAIYGVLTGGILALAIYCRVKRLPVLRVLDCLALPYLSVRSSGTQALRLHTLGSGAGGSSAHL
jgi:phosphatidylglycerol---prolipoprotein diacylglyceryl transferase